MHNIHTQNTYTRAEIHTVNTDTHAEESAHAHSMHNTHTNIHKATYTRRTHTLGPKCIQGTKACGIANVGDSFVCVT